MTTTDGYEKAYRDAREALFLRGKKVGGPRYTDDGLRYCPVDGFSYTDRDILRDAWGDSLADEILRGLGQNNAFPRHCAECDRLWESYTEATKRYSAIFRQLHAATVRRDTAAVAELDIVQRQAAQIQLSTRQSIRNHSTSHIART
jgi:hypothetical protein